MLGRRARGCTAISGCGDQRVTHSYTTHLEMFYRPCPRYFLKERLLCLFIEEVLTIWGFPLEEVFFGGPGVNVTFSLIFLAITGYSPNIR